MRIGNAKFVGDVTLGGKTYSPEELSSLLEGGGAPTVVEDNSTSNAYIPVLSGGMCYKYHKPLKSLEIGSITDTPKEDIIIFTADGDIAQLDVYFQSITTGGEGPYERFVTSKSITLVSSGGSCVFVPAGAGETKWQDREYGYTSDYQNCYADVWFEGGSFVTIAVNNLLIIKAVNVLVTGVLIVDTGDDISTLSSFNTTLDGVVASSGDNGVTWNYGGVTIPSWDRDDENDAYIFTGYIFNGSPIKVNPLISPCCNITMPSGTDLVGNSQFNIEYGHKYEVNVANNGIVIAERFTAPEPEVPHGYFYVGNGVADNFYWNADLSIYQGESVSELYITVTPDGDDLRLVLTNSESDLCTGTAPSGDLTNISWDSDWGIIYYPPGVEA